VVAQQVSTSSSPIAIAIMLLSSARIILFGFLVYSIVVALFHLFLWHHSISPTLMMGIGELLSKLEGITLQ